MSISTVSKALNNVDVVTPSTKQRVLAAAEKLNYVPNMMGKQLKSGQTNVIGFYTRSIEAPYFSSIADVIAREVGKQGYNLNIFMSSNKEFVMTNILGNTVDGLIGFEELLTQEDLQTLQKRNIKAVFIDRNIKSETMGSVVFNSYQAARQMTDYLIENGHREIGFIRSHEGVYDSEERLRGYHTALEAAGIPLRPDYILQGNFSEQDTIQVVTDYIKCQQELPTAFVAGNDLSAIGAIKAFKQLGYRVPEDVSVTGFDNIAVLEYFTPGVTTFDNPIELQGKTAVAHLIARGVLDRFYENVSIGLLNLVSFFDPEVVIIGGGISANEEFIEDLAEAFKKVQRRHDSVAFLMGKTIAGIKPAKLTNDAGMLGAVYQLQTVLNLI